MRYVGIINDANTYTVYHLFTRMVTSYTYRNYLCKKNFITRLTGRYTTKSQDTLKYSNTKSQILKYIIRIIHM